ncbi:MAG: AraC family transcriptional regulator ligand-binding domain-containing protein [Cellvibrionaceae bacterium]
MKASQSQPQKTDLLRFHNEFKNFSVDTEQLYRQLSIDPEVMKNSDTQINLLKHYELMEAAAVQKGDPYLGFRMGLVCQSSDLGMLGYMLRNAPDFEKAIEILHNYVVLLSPETQTSLLKESNEYILTFKTLNAPSSAARQTVDMTLAQFILIGRDAFEDETWEPERIYFDYPKPSDSELANFPTSSELIFDHYFSGVSFPTTINSFRRDDSDPQLLALLESQALQALKDHNVERSLLKHIQFLISSNIGNTKMTAECAASELGMSRRTMHRRLSEYGSTFNQLREDIVINIAKETLSTTTVSITELAHKLGYADSSAFDRAFKRLTGKRPLEYRKLRNPKSRSE